MKARLIGIAAIFTIVSILVVWLFREPSDIDLVRGTKPFSTQLMKDGSDTILARRYSLHMPYDEAVHRVYADLPERWSFRKDFRMASFDSLAPNGNRIEVNHARFVTGIALPAEATSIPANAAAAIRPDMMSNLPDAEGWVTIDTFQYVNSLEVLRRSLKGRFSKGSNEPVRYELVRLLPKSDRKSDLLPMNSDTSKMTADHQELEIYTVAHAP